MCIICQKCGSIAEYNKSYGRITCTRCSWKSEPMSIKKALGYTFKDKELQIKKQSKMKTSK